MKTRTPKPEAHSSGATGAGTSTPSVVTSDGRSVLPDWDVKRVGDLFTFLPTGNNARNELSDDGAVGYVHYGDVHTHPRAFLDCRTDRIPGITPDRIVGLPFLRDGDLIMVDASEDYEGLGKSVEVRNIDSRQIVAGLHTFLLRPNEDQVVPGFSAYLQNNRVFRENLVRLATGVSVFGVSKRHVQDIRLVVPKPAEQRAIASALSAADALIKSLDTLIAKKRAVRLAAMQQMLTGKKRLPGFKKSWTMVSIKRDAILKARIGWQGLTTAEYRTSGEYFLIGGTEFHDGTVGWEDCPFVDKWRYDQDENIQLRKGDVLITKDGTIGKVAFVDSLPGPATLNSGVFVVRPREASFDPRHFFYILRSRFFDEFLQRLAAGSTIIHLYQKDFETFEFSAPDIEEQEAIGLMLAEMDAEIALLKRRQEKAVAIKQGMMQALLTGKARLPAPEVEA